MEQGEKGSGRVSLEVIQRVLAHSTSSGERRDAVLLPIEAGQKGPRLSGWQKKTRADMRDAAYLARLEAAGNIGVLLGGASGGLCAIDIDEDAGVAPFLELNPGLRGTLITRGARGVQIWVRCKVDAELSQRGMPSWPKVYPLSFPDDLVKTVVYDKVEGKEVEKFSPKPFGEWRADGGQSVVAGRHPDGHAYAWLVDASEKDEVKAESRKSQSDFAAQSGLREWRAGVDALPRVLEIFFAEINWPEGLGTPWEADYFAALEEYYGPPYLQGESGALSMAEPFWAGRFAFENEVLHAEDERQFYEYEPESGSWEKRSDEQLAARLSQDILRAGRARGIKELCGGKFRNMSKLRPCIQLLKGEVAKVDAFPPQVGRIHLKNGMLDLTGSVPVLRGFSPRDYSRNPIPVAYDASAKIDWWNTRVLDRLLEPEDADWLQRWAGMLMLGVNLRQKILIVLGTGGAGKSTILNVLQKLVGERNCVDLRTRHLDERFEMESYIGKTLLIGSDVPGNFLQTPGIYNLKRLTGDDLITAELKGGGRVQMRGIFNCGIVSNSRLTLRTDDDVTAWRRRLCLMECVNAAVPEGERIENFDDVLLEKEGAAILNWAIEGALRILGGDKLSLTPAQLDRVDGLLNASDSVRAFLRGSVISAPTENVTVDELSSAYADFCAEQGWRGVSNRDFQGQLPDAMLELFRVAKRNDIKRNDENGDSKARKGFAGVQLAVHEDAP